GAPAGEPAGRLRHPGPHPIRHRRPRPGPEVTGVSAAADASSSVHVCAPDDPGWLAFLASQPGATLFHHPAWARVLSQTYGYRSLVLAQADPDGRIVGGLPAVELRGLRGPASSPRPLPHPSPPLP